MRASPVAVAFALSVPALPASAATIYPVTVFASTVIEYYDSGAGPFAGPYGSVVNPPRIGVSLNGSFAFATDADPNTSVSLPKGSFLTLGFGAPIIDGPGFDIFVYESGASKERGRVWAISAGGRMVELGEALDGRETGFDLQGRGFDAGVTAIRIEGIDILGASFGFDLGYVSGLLREPAAPPPSGGPQPPPPAAVVPVPPALGLLALAVAALSAAARRRS